MLNFMTKNKIENIEDIKKFDKDGYEFVEEMSLENKFVFDVTNVNGEDARIFHRIRKELIEQMKKVGILAIVSKKNFDNIVFNYISKKLKKQVIIGNSFTYDEYDIPSRVPNGIGICIIDIKIIVLKDLKEMKK